MTSLTEKDIILSHTAFTGWTIHRFGTFGQLGVGRSAITVMIFNGTLCIICVVNGGSAETWGNAWGIFKMTTEIAGVTGKKR